jgi:hypothetical protein
MIARPKGRGIETQKLEESQLLIFVQLLVLPPLVFHVLPDRVFIAVLADRACEIPIRPNSPPHSCFLTCGHRLNISRAVMLLIIVTIFVTL